VTNGYKRNESNGPRWSPRVTLPLLLVITTAIAAGCLREGEANHAGVTNVQQVATVPTSTPTPRPLASLSQDDPRLGMTALSGKIITSSIQVLPDGNVPTGPSAAAAPTHVNVTTTTQWVQNSQSTTLWSGPDSSATAFTDVPEDSYFRVSGPANGDRLPVYYVGDGLMRMAGNGWVDARSVVTVDAPAPGQVPAVDADARAPLPVWVQAHKATTLWSGPDGNAEKFTDLPQWTFLKVAGVERSGRLLVNYAGDYASRQPGLGWVDQEAVGPAGDPGIWVTNHRATSLWSGVDAKAVKFTDLPQWTKLQIVPGAPADAQRLEVAFFGDGATRQPGIAWVALTDVGPITPPVPLPTLPTNLLGTAQATQAQHQSFGSDSAFIDAVGAAARSSMKSTGVPASVTVAQAILESDWGRSRLTRQGNNLFGIKALSGAGPDGVVTLATWEHLSSGDVLVQAPFKAYFTLEQSIDDHGKFFTSNKRYADALAVARDPRAFARAIQDDGYATDPAYASKLIGLMDKYNLYRFDQ
jgi:mannosyl-glycoprotein endo-beta-N-acetylglucosaminidase